MARKDKSKAARAAARAAPEEDPEFQIAPMIDILLVLLVFFMSISSTEILRVSKSISLAVAKDAKPPEQNPQGQIVVNVAWVPLHGKGSIQIDSVDYATPGDLIPKLNAEVQRNPLTNVLVRVDRNAPWGFEREVLKAIGDAGISSITFSVVDKEGQVAEE